MVHAVSPFIFLPTTLQHLQSVNPQAAQADGWFGAMGIADLFIDEEDLAAHARTLMLNGMPVGCAGLVKRWPGYAEAWAWLSDLSLKYPLALTKSVKRLLEWAAEEMQLRRIEMTVDVSHLKGAAWAQALGFTFTAYLRRYDPCGRDNWLFERVFPHEFQSTPRPGPQIRRWGNGLRRGS